MLKSSPEEFAFALAVNVFVFTFMGSHFYDKKNGYPEIRVNSLPLWLFWNAAIGVMFVVIWNQFAAAVILTITVPFTLSLWAICQPESIAKRQAKIAEEKQKEEAEAAEIERVRRQTAAEEMARKSQEAAAQALREAEAQYPDANLEAYKTYSPNEISETARKLAEKLRPK